MESEQGVVKYKLKYGKEDMFISIIANELCKTQINQLYII